MPKNPEIKKVLVIGSGPIVIGQAAEFDYAGTQACRSLKEEGLEVVLLNSNPATIMTDKEIAEAGCIIVAADAQVPMDRFDGKKVIECQVSDGISKAGELLERAISGNAPVYHSASKTSASPQAAKKRGGIGHQIYTQLMNASGGRDIFWSVIATSKVIILL